MSFNPSVSVVPSINDGARVVGPLPIRAVLDAIKNGSEHTTAPVLAVRAAPDKAQPKKDLRSITVSGVFPIGETVAGKQPEPHSGLVQIDLDGKDNPDRFDTPEKINTCKDALMALPYVFAAFLSPSGTGLKILARIDPDKHEQSFRGICRDIKTQLGLVADKSTGNVNRLCFVSLDPDLCINKNPTPYMLRDEPITADASIHGEAMLPDDLKLPLGLSIEDAGKVIAGIDPDENYDRWLRVGQALFHEFSGSDDSYELWDKWSSRQGSAKYAGPEETRAKWDSFKTYASSGRTLTFRSVIHDRIQEGWNPAELTTGQVEKVEAWIQDPARTLPELKSEAVKRIASLVFASKVEREILLEKLHAVLAARSSKVSKTYLREALRGELVDRRKLRPDPLPIWATDLVFITSLNVFIDSKAQTYSPDALDHSFGKDMPPWSDAQPHEYLLNACQLPRASDFAYFPGLPGGSIIAIPAPDPRVGRLAFNTYRASYAPALDNSNPEDRTIIDHMEKLYRRHLADLIKEPEYQKVVADFLAFIAQRPGEKIRWALLFQSAPGAGKGTLLSLMRLALGASNVKDIDGVAALESEFNSFATGAQVVGLNEISNTGESHWRMQNKLKPLISDDTVERNEKFQPRVEVANVTNYILSSNSLDALPLDEAGDRRYFVIMSPLQTREDLIANNVTAHIQELRSFAEANPGAMRAVLLGWKISATFNHKGPAPLTPYLKTMAREAQSSLKREIIEAIENGDHPLVQPDLVSIGELVGLLPCSLQRTAPTKVGSVLRELGFECIGRFRSGGRDGERYRLWAPLGGPLTGDAGILDAKQLLDQRVAQVGLPSGLDPQSLL